MKSAISLIPIGLHGRSAEQIDEERRRRMLLAICLGGAAVAVVAQTLRVAFGSMPSLTAWAAFAGVVSAVMTTLLMLRRRAPVAQAAILPIAAMVIGVPILASQNGGLNAPIITLAPAIPIIAAMFLDTRRAILVAALLAIEVMLIALAGQMGLLPVVKVAPLAKGAILVAYMLVNVVIVVIYELERRAAETQLRALATDLYQSSIRDPLTQIFNRRHFAERLTEELAYARRHDTSVGVVVLDADHFKQINDTFGHVAGDFVLKELALLLRNCLRAEDVLARYGGEEFAALMRGIPLEQVSIAAERLRVAVEAHCFEYDGMRIRVTVSLGCASVSGAAAAEGTLLPVADARMYSAKNSGRNRVVSDGTPAKRSHSSQPPLSSPIPPVAFPTILSAV